MSSRILLDEDISVHNRMIESLKLHVDNEDIESLRRMNLRDYQKLAILQMVIEKDNLELLKRLVDEGYTLNLDIVSLTVCYGNISALEYLSELGIPFNEQACIEAAISGKLDTLIWLRKKGVAWDDRTLLHAIYQGHHHILKWAVENGCPTSGRLYRASIMFNRIESQIYLHDIPLEYSLHECQRGVCIVCKLRKEIEEILQGESYFDWLSNDLLDKVKY